MLGFRHIFKPRNVVKQFRITNMTQINSSTPIDFQNGKDNEIENFANLIIINCSKFEMFCLNDIISELSLDSNKEKQFNSIILDTTNLLKEYDFINIVPNTSGYFKLSQNGLLAKEKGGYFKYVEFIKNRELESNTSNVTYNINESVIGQLNHESNFSNSPITNNTTQNPKSELKTNSPILKFWKLISENKLISSFILALVLFAIKKMFNIEL